MKNELIQLAVEQLKTVAELAIEDNETIANMVTNVIATLALAMKAEG